MSKKSTSKGGETKKNTLEKKWACLYVYREDGKRRNAEIVKYYDVLRDFVVR